MNRTVLIAGAVAVGAVLIVGGSALYTVQEAEQALVLQFGEPIRVVQEPGLKVKMPFVQTVTYYDQRVLDYDHPAEEVIASDQKRLEVNSYARYRIVDPLRFNQTVGNEFAVRARLGSLMSASLRRVLGSVPLSSVLSEERSDIMREMRLQVAAEAQSFGIDVIDVRISRADLPVANAQAIYDRMQSERQREAAEFRAQGEEIAARIRARAEREQTIILAEARRQSEVLRGEGEGESTRIYAEAFGQDPYFFEFYRSMQAYRTALSAGSETTMLLSPDSEFFRFFGTASGTGVRSQIPDQEVRAPAAEAGQPVVPTLAAPEAAEAPAWPPGAPAPAPAQ